MTTEGVDPAAWALSQNTTNVTADASADQLALAQGRGTNDLDRLAADVRAALVRPYREAKSGDSFFAISEMPEFEALDTLVARFRETEARLEAAEQDKRDIAAAYSQASQRLEAAESALKQTTESLAIAERDRDGLSALCTAERSRGDHWHAHAEAAEAALAGMTADRDEYDALLGRKMAERDEARALLADTRQALERIVEMGDYVYKPHEFAEIARRALAGGGTGQGQT